MKRTLLLFVALTLGFSPAGRAATIVLGLEDLLGTISPSSPNSDVNHTVQVNFLVNAYNNGVAEGTNLGDNPLDPKTEQYVLYRPDGAPLNLATAVLTSKKDTSNSLINLNGMTYEYVLYKQAKNAWVYYIGDLPGDATIKWGAGSTISHWSLFNGRPYTPPPPPVHVPEAGGVVALLGLSLLGAALLVPGWRRRRAGR